MRATGQSCASFVASKVSNKQGIAPFCSGVKRALVPLTFLFRYNIEPLVIYVTFVIRRLPWQMQPRPHST